MVIEEVKELHSSHRMMIEEEQIYLSERINDEGKGEREFDKIKW